MALAARSSRAGAASDGRIPCPVCRQQIHPVAGRCKHCKTDLVKLREQHGVRAPRLAPAVLGVAPPPQVAFAPAPAVAAPVPTASAPVTPSSQTLLDPPPYMLPQVAVPPPADLIAAPMPYLGDATLTDLPAQRRPRWPLIVAIVAGVAIVICVLLLVLDKPAAKSSRTTNGVGVGTDSMDTQVTPPAPIDPGSPGDPWGAVPAPGDPNDPIPAQPIDPDPYQPPAPVPPPSTFNGTVPPAEKFFSSMWGQVCDKMKSCGVPGVDMVCSNPDILDSLDPYKDQVKTGNCTYDEPAARKCLESIGSFSCSSLSGGSSGGFSALSGMLECVTALSCPFSP